MIVECKNCGAPLDVDGKERYVRCSYCHKTNRVKTLRTLHFERPPGWVAPPTWTPPKTSAVPQVPLPRRPVPPPRSSASMGALAVMVILPLAVAVVIPLGFFGVFDFLPTFRFEPEGEPLLRIVDLDQEPRPAPFNLSVEDSVELASLAGAPSSCSGYAPYRPHLVLRTAHGAALTLETDSDQDNVMLLVTSDGEYVCDDDSGGSFNAAISRVVPAGDHRVWVGPYANHASFPVTLRVSADPVDAPVDERGLSPGASPALGRLELSPGVAHSFEGTTEPFVELSSVEEGCRGWVPVGPHVLIDATQRERVRLVTRDNDVDLVMAAQTPDGVLHCDDDSGEGLNPMLDLELAPGPTAVWVGTFHNTETGRFTLDVGEPRGRHQVGLGVDPIAQPVLATVNLDVPGHPVRFEGASRAEVNERTHIDPSCRGWVGRAPDITLLTTLARTVVLSTESDADLTLMVHSAPGEFTCDDDSGAGRQARLEQTLAPGTHQVWVGQARRRRGGDFTLSLEEPTP